MNYRNKASELPKEVIIVAAHDTDTMFMFRLEVSIRLYVHIRIIAYVK